MSNIAEDIIQDFRTLVGVDNIHTGVFLATPTGKFMEDDPTYIEVMIGVQSYYAKPCFSFGSWNIPSEKWLAENKDKIKVWVAFENGNMAHPVYLGIMPLDGNYPKDMPYKNGKNYKTTKFRYWFDDDSEEFYLEHFSKNVVKQSIKLDNKGIEITCGKNNLMLTQDSLSTDSSFINLSNADSSAIKGEDLVRVLLDTLSSIMGDTLIVSGSTANHSPAVISKLTELSKQLEGTLSKKVKLA